MSYLETELIKYLDYYNNEDIACLELSKVRSDASFQDLQALVKKIAA